MTALAKVNVPSPTKVTPIGRRVSAFVTSSDDREFLPAALEIIETPPSAARIAILLTICGVIAAAMIWSCVAKLDIYAVASGRIQPSGRSKVIQSLDPGRVKAVLVENGTKVKVGDPLVVLDPTDADAARTAAEGDLEAVNAEIPRRRAEIKEVTSGLSQVPDVEFPASVGPSRRSAELRVLAAEISSYVSSRESLRAQLAEKAATMQRLNLSLNERDRLIDVLRSRLEIKQELVRRAAGTRASVLDAQQQFEQEMTNRTYDSGQLLETEAARVSLERKLEQTTKDFVADQAQKLSDAEKKRDHLAQDLVKAVAKAQRTQLTAPIDGSVQQLAITTLGQVVTTGQPLMVIVPSSGAIEIEALVQNSDIGFVTVGQQAVVKIDAFPFTRYGTIPGKVVKVSRDAVYDKDPSVTDPTSSSQNQNGSSLSALPQTQGLVYSVTIELEKQSITVDGQEVPLVPGMTGSIDVRTGDRRVVDYLLAPLREAVRGAGHEH